MNSSDALSYLLKPRREWIDIDVSVNTVPGRDGINVTSTHRSKGGKLLQEFSICWPAPSELNTEYGYGLSVVHDVKDHYFYGLGITTLTEFQTIVQTYYGREVSGGYQNRAPQGNYISRVQRAIHNELFGPRGPRVYGPLETGLLDLHAIQASQSDRLLAYHHMTHICLDIMLPPLMRTYNKNHLVRQLQASTLDQPKLVDAFLSDVCWADEAARLLRLCDNVGLRIFSRAYVDEELAKMTAQIRDQICAYAKRENLLQLYGPIFNTNGYCVLETI